MVGAKERRQNNARQQPFASKDLRCLPSVGCARTVLFISKLACTVEVWTLFHPSFNCFHWFSKNCYFTAYHENLVYVAWKHLVSELPVSLQVHVANNYVFPIGALPPGRAEAREPLGRSGHNLGVSFHKYWAKQTSEVVLNQTLLIRLNQSGNSHWQWNPAPTVTHMAGSWK